MNRRVRWLLVALGLFIVVALLTPDDAPAPAPPRIVYRHFPRMEESERNRRRRTLPNRIEEAGAGAASGMRDPLLTALPSDAKGVLVFEASTFFTLPAGELLLRCIQAGRGLDERTFDPTQIDRMAIALLEGDQTLMVFEGELDTLRVAGSAPVGRERTYGEQGRVFSSSEEDASVQEPYRHARWGERLAFFGSSEGELERAVDRLEGRLLEPEPLGAQDSWGDVYGKLDGELASKLLPDQLRAQVREAELGIELHVDASEDVLLSIDASGEPKATRDLGKALASALALMRVQAKARGEMQLTRLLDTYAVRELGSGFQLEAALPLGLVRELLGKCAEEADAGL